MKKKKKKMENEKRRKKERGRQQLSRTGVCDLASRTVGALIDRQMFSTAGNLETDVQATSEEIRRNKSLESWNPQFL